MAKELLVVAGEASGDLHGARLLAELHGMAPDLRYFGLGGDELAGVGLQVVAHSREISVVGLTEVLRVLPRARRIFADLLQEAERRRPVGALLIDSPGFNLRLARQLNNRGIPVLYYISPQVWAWRPGRVRTIRRRVEKMLVLFPFEVDLYRQAGLPVVHVGHPLVDEVPPHANVWDRPGPEEAFHLALLPGSREVEVRTLLPVMLQATESLHRQYPLLRVQLIQAPTVPTDLLREVGLACQAPYTVVRENRFEAIARSHLALCASGTATLEVGLLGTPMLVLYRVGLWTSLLGRLMVRVPHISLVNLVLEHRVVPELVQTQVNPERVAHEARRLLADPEAVSAMRRRLAQLRDRLGEGGASRRAAQEVARHFALSSEARDATPAGVEEGSGR